MDRRDFIVDGIASCVLGTCAFAPRSGDSSLADAVELLAAATTSDGSPRLHVDRDHFTVVPGISAASLEVRRDGERVLARVFGADTGPRTPFVLASISKPITAAGVMLLVDRGDLSLDEPVRRFVPEFREGARGSVTMKQLLTHTSGLPDGFPELDPLLSANAPLERFLSATYEAPLLFSPGTEFHYSNIGILLAAEVVQRITRVPFRTFLRRELFEPLGMFDTSLGLGGRAISATAQVQLPGFAIGPDAFANSSHWRDIGAPWNGVHSTAADLSIFLDAFLRPDGRVLSARATSTMSVNQTRGLVETLPVSRIRRSLKRVWTTAPLSRTIPAYSWGLGWMMRRGAFGRSCSTQTFGHHGLTGTLVWADPVSRVSLVLLTTKPILLPRDGLLGPVSDHVSEAFLDSPRLARDRNH